MLTAPYSKNRHNPRFAPGRLRHDTSRPRRIQAAARINTRKTGWSTGLPSVLLAKDGPVLSHSERYRELIINSHVSGIQSERVVPVVLTESCRRSHHTKTVVKNSATGGGMMDA